MASYIRTASVCYPDPDGHIEVSKTSKRGTTTECETAALGCRFHFTLFQTRIRYLSVCVCLNDYAALHPSCYVEVQGTRLVLGPLHTALHYGVVVSRGHGK